MQTKASIYTLKYSMYTVAVCFYHTPPLREKKEHFLCIHICMCTSLFWAEECVFMRGLGQSSGKPHISNLGLEALRDKLWFTKKHTHTHSLKPQTLPDLTLTRPANRIANRLTQGNLGNRKQEVGHVQAECESSVHNELCKKLAVCGKACKDRLAALLWTNNVNCFNG